MKHCHTCKIECERPQRCSKCHNTVYCSVDCQRADWKVHKRSVCVKPAIFHQVDKMMKKSPVANRISQIEEVAWAARRQDPRKATKCDGCFTRFKGTPMDDDDLEILDMLTIEAKQKGEPAPESNDVGDPFKYCEQCDWTICESCSRPENQGVAFFERPPATCRCRTANFGVSYCLSHPFYLDGDGRNPYHGDRHPPIQGSVYKEDAFEKKERACRTCGIVARCLKKEHLRDAAPHVLQ